MLTVVIPALNESGRIESVVRFALQSPLTGEVLVIDDGSVDGTPEIARRAGAKVITSTLLGKGASMAEGLNAAQYELLLYLDGDLADLHPDLIEIMAAPLLEGAVDFVKARFTRAAGRVTVLTAKPLLQMFFPELAGFAQPLGGIIAARRSLLDQLHFETDYGVDLGLLIDASQLGARILEADIGHIEHESQSLEALGKMAKQVVRTVFERARRFGRLTPDSLCQCEQSEWHDRSQLSYVADALGAVERIALFDMDGTLVEGRYVLELARRTHRMDHLLEWIDNDSFPPQARSEGIARVFEGVPQAVFEETARDMTVTPGAIETIVALRKMGFRVGVLSDSYMVVSEIIRRRVYADFSIANLLHFRDGVFTGELIVPASFRHPDGCVIHSCCKHNVMLHLRERLGVGFEQMLVIGDNRNDICALRNAGRSFAFEPKSEEVAAAARHVIYGSLDAMIPLLQEEFELAPVASSAGRGR